MPLSTNWKIKNTQLCSPDPEPLHLQLHSAVSRFVLCIRMRCGVDQIKVLSKQMDRDKDPVYELLLTVSVDSLWTPTSAVIWLQVCGWCVGPQRGKREDTCESHTRMSMHTHNTHTCSMFSPAVSTVSFSQGLLTVRLWTPLTLLTSSVMSTHTYHDTHVYTFLWFRDVTSGWVWSVSEGLWLLFSTTYAHMHTFSHSQAQAQATQSSLESLSWAGDSSCVKAEVSDSSQCGLT